MKRLMLLSMVAAAGMLLGCSGENGVLGPGGTRFDVRYEVRFLSEGAGKITHKDSNGNEIADDPVTGNWEREFSFGDQVDGFLEVEASEVAPTNSVSVQLAIFVDGNRVQQATATITRDKKSNLSITRP